MSDENAPINSCAVPSFDLDAEALQAAAGKMKGAAATVRSSGAAIKSTWAGLAGVYHAPESATLLAAMDPVATHTDTFAGDATSVAGILQTFAAEAGPIAKTMATAKTDAAALENKIAGTDDWREDDDLVNQNNDLVKHVNSTLVAFQAAERRAANAIEALIGGHAFHAVDPNSEKQDKYAYGFASIPENARMPWGGKVEHKDGCFAATMTHIGHFFKGAAGALWGMVKGIGLFVWNGLGFGGWEAFKNQWVGIANMGIIGLFTLGPKEWARRNLAIGKELIHWDDWKNDPSKAAGETTVDLITIFATGGGAAAAKGTSAASKVATVTEDASKASKAADVAANAGKVTKAGGLAKNGIKLFTKYGDLRNLPALTKLPKIGDVLAGLKTKMGDLTGLGHNKISDDIHLPHSDGPDLPGSGHHDTPSSGSHGSTSGNGTHSDRLHSDGTHGDSGPQSSTHGDGSAHGSTHGDGNPGTRGDGNPGTHGDGQPHKKIGDDGHRHYDGDPDNTFRDHNGQLHDSTTKQFVDDPFKHDGIDEHASLGAAHPHQISDAHATEYQAHLAERTQAATTHATDLTARNAVIHRLEHDHGIKVDPRDLTSEAKVDKLVRSLRNHADSPAARAELRQLREASVDEVRSLAHLKASSESLGMAAGRDVVESGGGHVIVGHAGDATGAGKLDTIGLSGDGHTLRIAENKGGHSSLSSRMVGEHRVQQGTTAYLNELLHRDQRFASYLRENPEFAHKLARGEIKVEYDLVRALPGGGVKVQAFTIDQAHLRLGDLRTSHVGAGR